MIKSGEEDQIINNILNPEGFRSFIEDSQDAVVILNKKGEIVEANDSASELLRLEKKDLIGKDVKSFYKYRFERYNINKSILSNNNVRQTEVTLVTKFKEEIRCQVNSNCIRNNDEIIGFITTFKDVTEINELKQEITKTAINAEEKERQRIAEDLHDGINQMLASALMNVYSIENDKSGSAQLKITSLKKTLKEVVDEIRNITHNLSPAVIDEKGLHYAINQLAIETKEAGINIDLNLFDRIDTIDKKKQIMLYRIIQEFIQNSVKHSRCHNISVCIHQNEESIHIEMSDDGIGFNPDDTEDGIGLSNIKSRVTAQQGHLFIHSEPGYGVKTEIIIPL